MYSIVVNSTHVQIGHPLPDSISLLEVSWSFMVHMVSVTPEEETLIRSWVDVLLQRCTAETVLINGVIVNLRDLPYFTKEPNASEA